MAYRRKRGGPDQEQSVRFNKKVENRERKNAELSTTVKNVREKVCEKMKFPWNPKLREKRF